VINFKKNQQQERVDRLALEINPTVVENAKSGRNRKNLAMEYTYIRVGILSTKTNNINKYLIL